MKFDNTKLVPRSIMPKNINIKVVITSISPKKTDYLTPLLIPEKQVTKYTS